MGTGYTVPRPRLWAAVDSAACPHRPVEWRRVLLPDGPGGLKPHECGGGDILKSFWGGRSRSVPDAIAKSRDVDLVDIGGVGYHAVAILEVEPSEAAPGLAAVGRVPGRTFEPARIHQVGIARIHGHVINAPAGVQHILPAPAAVGRHVDASIGRQDARSVERVSGPRREIQARRIPRIHGDSHGAVYPFGQRHALPTFRPIARAEQPAVLVVAVLSILGPADRYDVQRSVTADGQIGRASCR